MNKLIKRASALGIALATVLGTLQHCSGQGTLQITFDYGPDLPMAGQAFFVQEYYEGGMWFRPLGVIEPGNGFVRRGGGKSFYPENGTAYLQASLGDSLQFSFNNGSKFNLLSVDLAEYSTVVSVLPVTFYGYYPDGSTVVATLTPDGIIDGTGPLADFQTFHFDKRWRDLTRVEVPGFGWSLDNLVVSTVPEPAIGVLLGMGALLVTGWRYYRRY